MTAFDSRGPFVGRSEELGQLGGALDQLTQNKGRVVVLPGGPGSGKTRLMDELAAQSRARDVRVLWSQQPEEPGAPPYFPWMLLLRALFTQRDPDRMLSKLGDARADLSLILPELRRGRSVNAATEPRLSTAARFQLHDSVTRAFLSAARQQPLLLLFDNLHCADRSSLDLLVYCCSHLQANPILVVGAYRDDTQSLSPALRATLLELSRRNTFSELSMAGLSQGQTAEILYGFLGSVPPATLVKSVWQRSDGNPLFITEAGALLSRSSQKDHLSSAAARFRVPDSLRAVIGDRLKALPHQTTGLLQTAAVAGRDFELACLAKLERTSVDNVLRSLQCAEDARIVEPCGVGSYRFTHALFREVLYEQHSTLNRVLLHRRAIDYIEQRYPHEIEMHLAKLAHHAYESAQTGPEGKAVQYCRLAGQNAVSGRAYVEAVSFFEAALKAAALDPTQRPHIRFQLLLELGEAQYMACQLRAATESLLRAALQAYMQQQWRDLTGALFRFQNVCQQSGRSHIAAVPLHLAALEHAVEDDTLRARLMCSLARAYRLTGDHANALAAFRESLALARSQNDRKLLLACMHKGAWVVGRSPGGAEEGLEIPREALSLAREQGDEAEVMDALVDMVFQLCDLGEIDEAETRLQSLAALAERRRQVHFLNIVSGFRTAIAILRGRWRAALQATSKCLEEIPKQPVDGLEGRCAFQMFAIQRHLGLLQDHAPALQGLLARPAALRLWPPGQVLLLCEMGRLDSAREALNELGSMEAIPRDDLYPAGLVFLAEACARLQDRERCAALYDLLLPWRERNVTVAGALMLGSGAAYLAQLAMVLQRNPLARELFEQALAMNASMRAWPLLACTQLEYAVFLSTGKAESDSRRACELLVRAHTTAERLGMQTLAERIDGLGTGKTALTLSRRECQVLQLVAAGYSNHGIADSLFISHSTVATHLRNILRKTGSANRTEAVDYGRRTGQLQSG